jgi:putative ABC transport system permease protein
MFQFVTEAVTFTLSGAVIGIVLGVVAGNPITRLLVNNSTGTTTAGPGGGFGRATGGIARRSGFGGGFRGSLSSIHASVGWSIILYGLAAAIIIAVVGSAIASFFIAKVRPAEVMRAE